MIKAYLRYRRFVFLFYLGVINLFPLVQYLHGFSLAPVIYGILVITFLMALCVTVDYIRFRNKTWYLKELVSHLAADRSVLPRANNVFEEQYQTIIALLYGEIEHYIETMERNHSEQVDYYTLWMHQIKTPISAMRLLLQRSDKPGNVDLLEQELFKIEQYVELALQFTKLGDLSGDLIIREYALEDIVNQSIKKYASLFIYKRLSLELEEFHAKVTTDSKWCSFILEQLISNAIKYTNKGGITITYTNRVLAIEDTGIGIRPEDTERIFEKGYTGYNGRVDKKASGIGLYLAKKVADSLAVKLLVASTVGAGTRVEVHFPEKAIEYYGDGSSLFRDT